MAGAEGIYKEDTVFRAGRQGDDRLCAETSTLWSARRCIIRNPRRPIPYSLFPIPYSLSPVPYPPVPYPLCNRKDR